MASKRIAIARGSGACSNRRAYSALLYASLLWDLAPKKICFPWRGWETGFVLIIPHARAQLKKLRIGAPAKRL